MAMTKSVSGGFSGSTLKILAMIFMVVDHTAASVIGRGYFGTVDPSGVWEAVYWIMRGIGRLAFPIFCFLLVEGVYHTRSMRNYFLRLLVFALASEIPFDLALNGEAFYWGYQNVFWTLALGVLALWLMGKTKQRIYQYLILIACMVVAQLLQTDYSAFGVFFIWLLWYFRNKKEWKRNLVGCVAVCWEVTAPLAFIPIHFYNGERGLDVKYVFYLFYPVHLLLLGFITYGLFGV